MHTRIRVGMINIANRHPKLHLFQAVTDFVKINVGMSISNVYHPNSYSCMHTFCTTIPTILIVFFTLVYVNFLS